MFELQNGFLFKIKSGISFPFSSYLNSKKRFFPKPVLLIVFKNCFGIIISVSIFTIGKYVGILLREINEDIEYDHNKVLEFVYFQLLARYYAIEGYYTISSLNVVVYELTLGAKLKLNKYDYILTIIENWMDFFEHIGNKLSDMSLLNYSKYLFRIYYSWNKLKKIGLKMPKFINLEQNLRISTFLKNNRGNIENINDYKDEINKLYNNKDIKEIKKTMYQQINYLIVNY